MSFNIREKVCKLGLFENILAGQFYLEYFFLNMYFENSFYELQFCT